MKYVYVPVFSSESRNVLFSPESEFLFKEMDVMASTDSIKKFIKTKFRKWVANNYPAQKHSPTKNDPDWVEKAIARGDTVYYVDINSRDAQRYKDYLFVLNRIKPPKLDKMTVEQVREQCNAYVEEEAKKRGTKLITKCKNGFYWVELTSPLAIRGEGHTMNNCLKMFDRYSESVANGTMRLFSLRDKNNNPHVDIEYNVPKKQILQLKGNSNTIPKEEYRMMVAEFLNSLDISDENLSVDIAQMWLAKVDGKYVSILDAMENGDVFDTLIVPPDFARKYPDIGTLTSKKDLFFTSVQANSIEALIAGHVHFVNSNVEKIETISVKEGCYFSNSNIDVIREITSSRDVCYFRESKIQDISNITCDSTIVQGSKIKAIQNLTAELYIVIRKSTINKIHLNRGAIAQIEDSIICLFSKTASVLRPMFKRCAVSFNNARCTKLGFEDCNVTLDSLDCKHVSFAGRNSIYIGNPKSVKIKSVLLGPDTDNLLEYLLPLKNSIVIEADIMRKRTIESYGFQYKKKKVEIVSYDHFSKFRLYYDSLYKRIPKNTQGVMLASSCESYEYREFCRAAGNYLLCDI